MSGESLIAFQIVKVWMKNAADGKASRIFHQMGQDLESYRRDPIFLASAAAGGTQGVGYFVARGTFFGLEKLSDGVLAISKKTGLYEKLKRP